MDKYKVWHEYKIGLDGKDYTVRYLLTEKESKRLTKAGLVYDLWQGEHPEKQPTPSYGGTD